MNTFKKTTLYTALAGIGAFGMAGTASAVHVNADGLGQVLIYPYYTVQNQVGPLRDVGVHHQRPVQQVNEVPAVDLIAELRRVGLLLDDLHHDPAELRGGVRDIEGVAGLRSPVAGGREDEVGRVRCQSGTACDRRRVSRL